MKRLLILGVLLFGLVLAIAPSTTAITPPTTDTRDKIHFAGGTFDINGPIDYQTGSIGTSYHYSGPIPGEIGDFIAASSGVGVLADGGDITYSLTVNTIAVATGVILTDGNSSIYNLTYLMGLGLSATAKTMDILLTVNNTYWDYEAGFAGNDVPVNPLFFNQYITIEEIDVTTPGVDGLWQVTDTITNNLSRGIDFTDTNFTIGYPGACVQDSPDLNPWIATDFNWSDTLSVTYQKSGPAIDENIDVEDDTSGANHAVTVTLASDDELSDVDWSIDTDDPIWDGALDNIDEATFKIELNGHIVDDWELGSIDMEGIDINEGDNEFVFTWTAPSGTVTPQDVEPEPTAITPQEALETEYYGVPAWAILAIAIVIIIAVIAIVKIEK